MIRPAPDEYCPDRYLDAMMLGTAALVLLAYPCLMAGWFLLMAFDPVTARRLLHDRGRAEWDS